MIKIEKIKKFNMLEFINLKIVLLVCIFASLILGGYTIGVGMYWYTPQCCILGFTFAVIIDQIE